MLVSAGRAEIPVAFAAPLHNVSYAIDRGQPKWTSAAIDPELTARPKLVGKYQENRKFGTLWNGGCFRRSASDCPTK